jgi:hypothetical protein
MVCQDVLVNYRPFLRLVNSYRHHKAFDRSVLVYQWQQEQEKQGISNAIVFIPDVCYDNGFGSCF